MSWNEMDRAMKSDVVDKDRGHTAEVLEMAEHDRKLQKQLAEKHKHKIKNTPVFAPPSFKARITAN